MMGGTSTRNRRIPTHPILGKPSEAGGLRWRSLRSPRTAFWVHHLCLQPFIGTARHREFSLELSDPPLHRHQLCDLVGGQPRSLAGVDQHLTAPLVDRLVAHAEIASDRRNRPPHSKQIQNLATELGRIPVRQTDPPLRVANTTDSSIPTPQDRGKTRA